VWQDVAAGRVNAHPERFGDIVIARKETPTSYHLAMVVDDHLQKISLVTRGQDLFESTDVHRLLQKLLNLNVPQYHHHPLVIDKDGNRLAKRNDSLSIKELRQSGATLEDIRTKISEGLHD
jgi:glutamyl-Q tRNA(Asp) synthetase